MRKEVLIVLIVIGCAYGGYTFGFSRGFNDGEKVGHDQGYANAQKDYLIKEQSADKAYDELSSDYNKLVKSYNSLLKSARSYVNVSQYRARQPLNCTSMTYGIDNQFTTTNCY